MKERYEWLDISKGIAILLVVLGHAIQYYLYPIDYADSLSYRVIYSFHMPFFFFLSGLSSGFSNNPFFNKDNLKKKIKRLMIPYVAWGLIYLPANLLYKGWSTNLMTDLFMNPPRFGLWYLYSLFFIWLFHTCILSITDKGKIRFVLYIFLYLLLLILASVLHGEGCINEISKYFIFYVIGSEWCLHWNNGKTPPPITALYA